MDELVYKCFLGALVLAMNAIRMYYQKRYSTTHLVKEARIAPRREKGLTYVMFFAMAAPGMLWLFTPLMSAGRLALPDWARLTGFGIGVYGMWWFYRIHKTLGDNWSPVLEIRRGHTLITSGPYSKVRHPMYSDMLLWLVSFALVTANWLYGASILTGLTILFAIRIPDEERLMTERFGDRYRAYMGRTKRLIPFIF
ncbi:MAG: isoprenylcysteine carboxylmethyltransferase family protein [Tannerellaceae bacterium]|jgi:protein-S-isoprenylcysteine O-methyltransferase Ste14|nr:isoprenylcysteine carboxylmethyltransferase family protein [Tannerellaceae bacterium]